MKARNTRPRRRKVKIVYMDRGKELTEEVGRAIINSTLDRMQERGKRLLEQRLAKIDELPAERRPLERAMIAVEDRMVKAMWILQRLPGGIAPSGGGSGWPPYLAEAADLYAKAIENGGWKMPAPRPAPPAGKDIDAAHEAQGWLRYLDVTERKVLVLGAMTKQGDTGRRVDWERVKPTLPEQRGRSTRWFRLTYTEALRNIVIELTNQKLAA